MSEAKCSITSGEFIRWQTFYLRQYNQASPDQWYLAAIRHEVARLIHEVRHLLDPKPPPFADKLSEYLLKFNDPDKPPEQQNQKSEEELAAERELYLTRSMAFWSVLLSSGDESPTDPKKDYSRL